MLTWPGGHVWVPKGAANGDENGKGKCRGGPGGWLIWGLPRKGPMLGAWPGDLTVPIIAGGTPTGGPFLIELQNALKGGMQALGRAPSPGAPEPPGVMTGPPPIEEGKYPGGGLVPKGNGCPPGCPNGIPEPTLGGTLGLWTTPGGGARGWEIGGEGAELDEVGGDLINGGRVAAEVGNEDGILRFNFCKLSDKESGFCGKLGLWVCGGGCLGAPGGIGVAIPSLCVPLSTL